MKAFHTEQIDKASLFKCLLEKDDFPWYWVTIFAKNIQIFHIEEGQTLFSKIALKPKPPQKPFNSSKQFTVQIGKSENNKGYTEMVIPEDSLLRDDGTVFFWSSKPKNGRREYLNFV